MHHSEVQIPSACYAAITQHIFEYDAEPDGERMKKKSESQRAAATCSRISVFDYFTYTTARPTS
jgi:hypothetical protein